MNLSISADRTDALPQANLSAWLQTILIVLTLLFLPLANGGVSAGARALATVLLVLAVLINMLPVGRAGRAGWDAWQRAWLWPWLGVSAMIAVQMLPLPTNWLHYLGAYPADLLREPGLPFLHRLSPNLPATLGYWAMFTGYWAAAYLVACLPRRLLRWVVLALVSIVAFESLYGLIAHLGRHSSVLGLWPARDNHFLVLGTYFNRNHLAGLLELGWPLGIAFLLYGVSASGQLRAREVRYFWLVCFCVVVALALFNTQSRLGSFGGLFGLLVFVLIARYEQQRGQMGLIERFWLWTAGVLALLGAIWFGLGPLLSRYADILDDASRLEVWSNVFDLPAKTWLLGAGAGAFEDVFKLVQTAELRASYVYLHNDWLQFVLEFGVLGTLFIGLLLLLWWRRIKPSRYGGLRAGACGGIAAIALHSIGDFNLQIPGTAFAFWVCLGVLCNRHLESRGRRRAAAASATSAVASEGGSAAEPE